MFTVSITTENTEYAEKIKEYINESECDVRIFPAARNMVAEIEENHFQPDIVFIETIVDKCSGVSIAARIKRSLPHAQIVFLALRKCSKIDVYDVEHVYTIYSDVTEEKVVKAMNHAYLKLNAENMEFFWYMKNGAKHSVKQADVVCFEKDRRKVRVHLADGSCDEFYENMETLLSELSKDFLRCHNSYVVNVRHVRVAAGNLLGLDNNMEVPVSRAYAKEVKRRIGR